MKPNLILFFSCMVVTIVATHAQERKPQKHPVVTISAGKALKEINQTVLMTDGEGLLFEITTSNGGDPRIDKQVIRTLIFVIPEDATHFEFTNFVKCNSYVVISGCRCVDLGHNRVIDGMIKGELKNGQWEISADVTAKGKDSGNDLHFKYQGTYQEKSKEN